MHRQISASAPGSRAAALNGAAPRNELNQQWGKQMMTDANDEPKFCWVCEKYRDAVFYAICDCDDEARIAELMIDYNTPCPHQQPRRTD